MGGPPHLGAQAARMPGRPLRTDAAGESLRWTQRVAPASIDRWLPGV